MGVGRLKNEPGKMVHGAGNRCGQQVLHSPLNLDSHPVGFNWTDASVAADSQTIAEPATAGNWGRVLERKAVALTYLKSTL